MSSSEMMQPKLGAGLWGSLRFLSGLVYAGCMVLALPMQMLLHRRFGNRYLNPFLFVASLVLLCVLVVLSMHASVPRTLDRTHIPLLDGDRVTGARISWAVLYGLLGILPVAYVLHRLNAWWRWRAGDVVHSVAWGTPHFLLLGVTPGMSHGRAEHESKPKPPSIVKPPDNLFAELWCEHHESWEAMWKDLAGGRIPEGRVPWLIATAVEPLIVCVLAFCLCTFGATIGLYFFLAAAAMFVQARIASAWAFERMLDHCDNMIAQEAWGRVLSGKPSGTEAQGYALPISTKAIRPELRQRLVDQFVHDNPSMAKLLKPARPPAPANSEETGGSAKVA
ncbi:MAG TPA: hypothetical protein VFF65_09140 [Phycisphaerales bacterium]|nr:hypothetical protein [Phycisphaerales bacterium]